MNSSFDVITLGYIFNEHISFPDHKEVGPVLGGTVSYSSICLGKLGTKTGIVSNIGIDTPSGLLEPFYNTDIDTQGPNMRMGISTTKDLLVYDKNGNKTIKYLARAPKILLSDIPDEYFDTKIFYLCPVDYEIPVSTVEKIRGKGRYKIAADLGGFGGAHVSIESREEFRNNTLEILKAYMQYIDIAKASLEDCFHLFSYHNTPKKNLEALLDYGPGIVILTMGEKGALIGTGNDLLEILPIKSKVVDCTGAGDTFTSGFLSEFLVSGDIKKAGVFAAGTASLLIEKTGGVDIQRFPLREDVLERIKKYI